jgi:hypothetical protein
MVFRKLGSSSGEYTLFASSHRGRNVENKRKYDDGRAALKRGNSWVVAERRADTKTVLAWIRRAWANIEKLVTETRDSQYVSQYDYNGVLFKKKITDASTPFSSSQHQQYLHQLQLSSQLSWQ